MFDRPNAVHGHALSEQQRYQRKLDGRIGPEFAINTEENAPTAQLASAAARQASVHAATPLRPNATQRHA
jgi:hypothetical protein